MTDTLAHRLKEAATKATQGEWGYEPDDESFQAVCGPPDLIVNTEERISDEKLEGIAKHGKIHYEEWRNLEERRLMARELQHLRQLEQSHAALVKALEAR